MPTGRTRARGSPNPGDADLLIAVSTAGDSAENEVQHAEAEFAGELTEPFRQAVDLSRADAFEAYRGRGPTAACGGACRGHRPDSAAC